jgi:hypothetical protein
MKAQSVTSRVRGQARFAATARAPKNGVRGGAAIAADQRSRGIENPRE